MPHYTHFIGKAGEYAVASQLLLRGITVHFPAVDIGADLIAGERLRLQIKSARISASQVKRQHASQYVFNLSATVYRNGKLQAQVRDWTKVVDFFVFWGVDENRFWIAPSHLITARHNVTLGSISDKFTVNREEIRALLKTGICQKEAAERLGVSEMSVSRAVHDWTPAGRPGACFEIARRENAWHEIISALGLVNSIESIQSTAKEGTEVHA